MDGDLSARLGGAPPACGWLRLMLLADWAGDARADVAANVVAPDLLVDARPLGP